jgi:hypothetical protein
MKKHMRSLFGQSGEPRPRRKQTNTKCWRLASVIGALALAMTMMPNAQASCAPSSKPIKPMNWHPQYGAARLMPAAFPDEDSGRGEAAPIVGMWHVIFTAKTMNGATIPDTPIDNALVVWHSDHTEIMNSGRPPQDGDFCMGVWERTDKCNYKLNHFAWGGNEFTPGAPNGFVGDPGGPTHVIESVTLSDDGKRYSGTFTLDAYDTSGKVSTSFTGVITATRITVDTKVADLL